MAGFVTAHARLRLYTEIEKLGKRVLYFDTDSMIYEYQKEKYNIPDGKYLGEWECETENIPITDFVSIGPKSYSYKYGEVVNTKFKGFSLNYSNAQNINFEKIKDLVFDNSKSLETTNLNFKKDVKNGSITTEDQIKIAKFGYDKSQIINTTHTLPHGWTCQIPPEFLE